MKEDILIENVRYVMEKNHEHNDRLYPVLEYLENIVRVKTDGSKRIWYFGTDGGCGHYPKCIKGFMPSDEYSKLRNVDSESFEKIACVGDRLYTDIAVGINAGATSICVLTGEATKEEIAESQFKPDYVFDTIKELYQALL